MRPGALTGQVEVPVQVRVLLACAGQPVLRLRAGQRGVRA
jgi:hypothetical protein